jgi:predicted O-linked N-acetylglucosamine transferase (SPINDLY family)
MNPQLQSILQRAIQTFRDGNFDGAALIIKEVLQNDINTADTIFGLGIAYLKANRLPEALVVFCVLQHYQNQDVRIPYNLGLIYSIQGEHQLAFEAYELALKINPDDPEVLINKGSTCNDIKNYASALEALERAIQLKPDVPEAWSNKGIALNNLNLYQDAIDAYDEAIKLNPSYYEAWSNKSVPLKKLKRFTEAVEACDEAISLNPNYAEGWSNKGAALHELKRYEEALMHYDKALSLKPDYAEGWFNKGNTLHELRSYEEALMHYDQALSLNPDYAEGWSNKGNALHELKFYEEAIAHYDKALSLKPDYADAWSNKGVTLNGLKLYEEAIAHYDKALSLKSDINWILGDLLRTKMKIADWSGLAESLQNVAKDLMANKPVIQPFALLGFNDDAFLHKRSSEIYTQSQYPFNTTLGSISKRPKSQDNQKIRIAYFSADFKNHPVAYLIAELFELHDKSQFETYAFSLMAAADEMRSRLHQVFDHFIDAEKMSDVAIAQYARDLDIDIAIDLSGFTEGSRTGIFSYRAAPIQVNYLGYPGTMGADYIDYIIADKTLIPPDSQQFYSEKVVYLPASYQVNDRKRVIADRQFTRQALGLPEDDFVFCCFNNNHKILPATFAAWMRILKAVEGSVLWLLQDNPKVVENLRKEADKLGVDPNRLVFAERMALPEHLARHRQADLFLDTLPYNAHTTTSDALWAGLPVLTLMGQSFASRVAASLLQAIGLPELITSTPEEYEALAIELAKHPQKLTDIKQKLANNRLTTPLFDTPLFTQNMETAYLQMMERYWAELPAEHLFIKP